jgi:hypothetical protein
MEKKQINELRNLLTEIEGQTIKFDSDNWPQCQQTCVEWGDKVAPFLNTEEKNKFNRELDTIRAVIYKPFLPSDFSGAPKEGAFNKMKSIAKQRLQELDKGITVSDIAEEALHLPSKVTVPWILTLFKRMSFGTFTSTVTFLLGIFGSGVWVGQSAWYQALTTRHNQSNISLTPTIQSTYTAARKVSITPGTIKKDAIQKKRNTSSE